MKQILTVAVIFLFATTSLVSAQVIRGNPKAGQGVYEQQCLRCHGVKLDGNGPDSRFSISDQSFEDGLGAARGHLEWSVVQPDARLSRQTDGRADAGCVVVHQIRVTTGHRQLVRGCVLSAYNG